MGNRVVSPGLSGKFSKPNFDFKITNSEIMFLDHISNVTKFVLAYEYGINNTPMIMMLGSKL